MSTGDVSQIIICQEFIDLRKKINRRRLCGTLTFWDKIRIALARFWSS